MAGNPTIVRLLVETQTETDTALIKAETSHVTSTLVKLSPIIIIPWIMFSIDTVPLANQGLFLTLGFTTLGLLGTLLKKQSIVLFTYGGLLTVFIWGKAIGDLFKVRGPDTALFLTQFVLILLSYELTTASLVFERDYESLRGRNDNYSRKMESYLVKWYTGQLQAIVRISLIAIGLSLGLLLLGALLSIQINQLAFTGVLVILSFLTLFFLLTHRREPEEKQLQ